MCFQLSREAATAEPLEILLVSQSQAPELVSRLGRSLGSVAWVAVGSPGGRLGGGLVRLGVWVMLGSFSWPKGIGGVWKKGEAVALGCLGLFGWRAF